MDLTWILIQTNDKKCDIYEKIRSLYTNWIFENIKELLIIFRCDNIMISSLK